jgi:hypothetical protein
VQSGSRDARENYSKDGRERHNRQELDQHKTGFMDHLSNSYKLRLLAQTQSGGRNDMGFLYPPAQSIENKHLVPKCVKATRYGRIGGAELERELCNHCRIARRSLITITLLLSDAT